MRSTPRSQDRNRCQSTDSSGCIVSSILKKPNRSKLKHQRSVRFEEPESPGINLEHNVLSVQGPISSNSSIISSQPYIDKNSLSCKTASSKFPEFGKESKTRDKETLSQSPVKIITVAKAGIFQDKGSPKSAQKTLKIDSRDSAFYNKLNYYLNSKNSLSPIRNEPGQKSPKKKIGFSLNQAEGNSEKSAEVKTEKGKGSPVKRQVKVVKISGTNVLN